MKQHAFLLAILLAASIPALAQTQPPPPATPVPSASFAQHQAAMIAKVEARIAREQSLLSCLQSAQTRRALKACKLAARPAH